MGLRRAMTYSALIVIAVLIAGCGDDDGDGATSEAAVDLDADGDGKVTIGIAAQGPRDDGGYYEAVVAEAERLSDEFGFESPIVVDNIEQTNADQELRNLAEQGVDIIFVGASGIAEPLPTLAEEFADIFWYCNCGAGFAESEFYAQSGDDSSEISYTAGVATGLLVQERGGDSTHFLGCCDLEFERESFLAFERGLQSIDDGFSATYVETGDFPFDFDNVANATAAFDVAVEEGTAAVYPFLGGAHEPVVALANDEDVIAMSAGASDACERDDLEYDIAVRFDGGDYIRTLFPLIVSGEFTEGDTKTFHVGGDPEPGAVICEPTSEQEAALDAVYAQIGDGELDELFGEIKAEVYGG